jgi:hypothetical protein
MRLAQGLARASLTWEHLYIQGKRQAESQGKRMWVEGVWDACPQSKGGDAQANAGATGWDERVLKALGARESTYLSRDIATIYTNTPDQMGK